MLKRMKLKSLGYQSDLIFPSFEGDVKDCSDYLRIRTPKNPSYWWGNFLLFEKPPEQGDFERWVALFEKEIGKPPETEHMVFAWDLSDNWNANNNKEALQPFLQAGFRMENSVVQTASHVHLPPKPNSQIQMRTLASPEDFAEQLELHMLLGIEEGLTGDGYRVFLERKQKRYDKMIKAGLGVWFGAYLNGKLVADMGLFHNKDIARYQTVGTHPEYRRQGIAGTLVHFAGEYGFKQFGVKKLVMIADDDYFAKDIYASVGFKATELIYALERPPK